LFIGTSHPAYHFEITTWLSAFSLHEGLGNLKKYSYFGLSVDLELISRISFGLNSEIFTQVETQGLLD
jgi:hypothetical protein